MIENGEYYIFVGARGEELSVAGTIGYQSGLYLQHYLGRKQDHEEAVEFAKYVTAQSSIYPTDLVNALHESDQQR